MGGVTKGDVEATKRFHITNNLIQILFELKANPVREGWVEKWTEIIMRDLDSVPKIEENEQEKYLGKKVIKAFEFIKTLFLEIEMLKEKISTLEGNKR